MSAVRARVIGSKRLESALAKKARQYKSASSAGLTAWAQLVRNHAVNSIQKGPKSGQIYARGKVLHQASAPGQAPAIDTGNLSNSIGWNVDARDLIADVFASAQYAIHLEIGTRNIKPRPFLVPALDAMSERGLAIFKATLARAS